MSLRKLSSLFLAAALIAAVSCDKDEEAEVLPSLQGTLSFNVPEYIYPDQILTMTPEGLSHPDDEGIGYYWKVVPGMTKSDTTCLQTGLTPDGKPSDGSFTYQFPDSLGTYTISCYGFASGYSTSYTSTYVTIVKGGLDGSITGTGIAADDPSIEADGKIYYYVNHGGLDWFRNNLANPSYGVAFANSEAMSDVFGRFYSFEEALKACPEGWRLPTDAEWRELATSLDPDSRTEGYSPIPAIAADLMGEIQFNTSDMWDYWPAVGEITNKGKLAVIPSGYANLGEKSEGGYPTASFFGVNEYAAFWTADIVEDEEGMAYFRYLICDQPDMQIYKGDTKTFGANVRCVRENN